MLYFFNNRFYFYNLFEEGETVLHKDAIKDFGIGFFILVMDLQLLELFQNGHISLWTFAFLGRFL